MNFRNRVSLWCDCTALDATEFYVERFRKTCWMLKKLKNTQQYSYGGNIAVAYSPMKGG